MRKVLTHNYRYRKLEGPATTEDCFHAVLLAGKQVEEDAREEANALHIEKKLKGNKEGSSKKSPGNQNKGTGGSKAKATPRKRTPKAKNPVSTTAVTPFKVQKRPYKPRTPAVKKTVLSAAEQKKRQDEGLCFKCGKKGHMASACLNNNAGSKPAGGKDSLAAAAIKKIAAERAHMEYQFGPLPNSSSKEVSYEESPHKPDFKANISVGVKVIRARKSVSSWKEEIDWED